MEFRGTSTITGGVINVVLPSQAAPVISGVSFGTPTETTATITWTTDTLSDSNICRGAQGGPWSTCVGVDAALVTSHTMVFTGLTASTTYYFKVFSVDNLGQSGAPNTETSFATAASATSGPPDYLLGSRSTSTVVETNWSNTNPANNTIFTDTTYGTNLVQVADNTGWETNWTPSTPPSMELNLWDKASAYFALPMRNSVTSIDSYILMDFNTTTLQATIHAGTGTGRALSSSGTPGYEMTGAGRFADTAPYASPDEDGVFYGWSFNTSGVILKFTVSTLTFSTVKVINDADCMNGTFVFSAGGDLLVSGSGANRRFLFGGNVSGDSPASGQNNWTIQGVYDATLGCRWRNTNTGVVSQGAGSGWASGGYPTGTVSSATRGKMHNWRGGNNGAYAKLSWDSCSGTTNCFGSVWDVTTLNTYDLLKYPDAMDAGGHNALGYNYVLNHANSFSAQFKVATRPVTNMATPTTRFNIGTPLVWSTNTYENAANSTSDDLTYFGFAAWRADSNAVSNGPFINKFTMVKTFGTPLDWSIQFNLCHADPPSFSYNAQRVYVSHDGKFAYWVTQGDLCGTISNHRRGIVAKLR